MKNQTLTLNNIGYVIQELRKLVQIGKTYYINVSEKPKKRSKPANDVYYVWLPEIADCLAMLKHEARRYLKLTFGLNILFSGDVSEKALALHKSLTKAGFFEWDYESQLVEMDQRNVTSIMTTAEHKQMRDEIQYFFGLQGLALEYEK